MEILTKMILSSVNAWELDVEYVGTQGRASGHLGDGILILNSFCTMGHSFLG